MRALFLTMICTAALALPEMAAAQGNAGGDQYTENVPTADGQTPSDDINAGSGDSGSDGSDPTAASRGGALAENTATELGKKGADGDAVAELSEAGAPDRDEAENAAATASGEANFGEDPAVNAAASSGPAGLGIGLPIILILSLLVALAIRLARRGEAS